MNKIISVIGDGGHARSVIALLLDCGYTVDGFYSNSILAEESILGIRGLSLDKLNNSASVVIAIGDNKERTKVFLLLKDQIVKSNIIHDSVYLHSSVNIDKGSMIFANSFIGVLCNIGENCIINTGCIIEHECTIGNNCHISIGAVVAGRVKIGNNCFLGAGSVVRDKVEICDNVIVGAGAVVVKNITVPGTYIGNPAIFFN